MFAPLAPASLEFLARRLVTEEAATGTVIGREGDPATASPSPPAGGSR